jgi:hypothetical protein
MVVVILDGANGTAISNAVNLVRDMEDALIVENPLQSIEELKSCASKVIESFAWLVEESA